MQQYPFIFSDERKYRIRRHLYFWLFWWVFFSLLYAYTAGLNLLPDSRRLPVSTVNSIFFMAPHMFLSYSLMYFVVPQFILKGKYKSGAALVLLLFFVTACFSAVVGMYFLPGIRAWLFPYNTSHPDNATFFLSLLGGLRGAITIGGLAASIKLMKYWYVKEQRNLQLQKENVESQLQLLKAQVHPHFLFNTLNNIYSYTQNTAPVAAKMVTGLSDLLRFMLYECNQPLVPLSKEIKMIQDYINLEKIRYGNRLELHLDLPEDTKDIHIAPLLLLPLVENCFKHGTSNMLEQPWINLQVNLLGTQMQMKLMNGKTNQASTETTSMGIGIKNVEKRLALLYPGKHELNILNEEDVFIINLKVELEYQKSISTINTKKQEVPMPDTMIIKCLVVDDEPPAREIIRRYIEEMPTLELVAECANAIQAFTVLQQQPVDLMFLDIRMPQLNGNDFLKTLKNPPKVIFTTAYTEYALEGYELDVVDYLMKPIPFDRFLKAVNKAFQHTAAKQEGSQVNEDKKSESFVYFRADRKMVKVMLQDILYIESMKDYIKVMTATGVIITKQSISSVEAMLPEKDFVRVHRSYIVSLHKIKTFTSELIEIDKAEIPIGKLYRNGVLKILG